MVSIYNKLNTKIFVVLSINKVDTFFSGQTKILLLQVNQSQLFNWLILNVNDLRSDLLF